MACPGAGHVTAAQVNGAAAQLGIPCWVVWAQLMMESGGQDVASYAGAEGPWQFLPSTWSGLGCGGSIHDPAAATACYIKYMGQLLHQFGGDIRKALAGYNAGAGNIGAGMGYANTILANAAAHGAGATRSTGVAPAGAGVQVKDTGGGGGGGGITDTSGAGVQLTSVWSDLNPVSWIGSLWKDLSGPVKAGVSIADSLATVARDFEDLIKAFGKILAAIEWFFVPSHWVRIFAFTFGVAALLPGLYALMKTGSGSYGDITLALGILLVTLSGVLLFIAFHNLPDSVRDLRGLLSWISDSVRRGAPAGSTAG